MINVAVGYIDSCWVKTGPRTCGLGSIFLISLQLSSFEAKLCKMLSQCVLWIWMRKPHWAIRENDRAVYPKKVFLVWRDWNLRQTLVLLRFALQQRPIPIKCLISQNSGGVLHGPNLQLVPLLYSDYIGVVWGQQSGPQHHQDQGADSGL